MYFKFQSKTLDPDGIYGWNVYTLFKLGKFRITHCSPTWNYGIMFYNKIGGCKKIVFTVCLFNREIQFQYK